MYKKSVEASQKLKEEEDRFNANDDILNNDSADMNIYNCHQVQSDRRSESIAMLRAKAQSFRTGRMFEGLASSPCEVTWPVDNVYASSFQQPAAN
jgi:hypothetical protein